MSQGMDRRGFLKALGALGGLGAAAAVVGPGMAAGAGAAGLVRRTESGEPRVLLHEGAVLQNVTVENAAVDVQTDGPVSISDCRVTVQGGTAPAITVRPKRDWL